MSNPDSIAVPGPDPGRGADAAGAGAERGAAAAPLAAREAGGLFAQYKPEQGKTVRFASYAGVMALVLWGMVYLYNQLQVYAGDETWQLLVTVGIPIAFAVLAGALGWWVIFGRRDVGDFMIATEGEMKKVNWSSRGEIIGSTKVVIVFTILMAVVIFVIDIVFQQFMTFIGVLKV